MKDKPKIPEVSSGTPPQLIMQVGINGKQLLFGGDVEYLADYAKSLEVLAGIITWMRDIQKNKGSRIVKPKIVIN